MKNVEIDDSVKDYLKYTSRKVNLQSFFPRRASDVMKIQIISNFNSYFKSVGLNQGFGLTRLT